MTLLLLLAQSVVAEERRQDGVIIHKTPGGGYMFIFSKGVSETAAGKITIGSTITVAYGLKILGGHARFVLFDTSKAPVEPKLSVEQAAKTFGFLVKDANVPRLHIFIEPSFMSKSQEKTTEEKVARHGNLNVFIERNGQLVRIQKVILN